MSIRPVLSTREFILLAAAQMAANQTSENEITNASKQAIATQGKERKQTRRLGKAEVITSHQSPAFISDRFKNNRR